VDIVPVGFNSNKGKLRFAPDKDVWQGCGDEVSAAAMNFVSGYRLAAAPRLSASMPLPRLG